MILRNSVRHLYKPASMYRKTNAKSADRLVCIDIESTCDSPTQISPMEIIEIACLKVDTSSQQRDFESSNCSTFHRYIRPIHHPKLTLFCQDLTGILQSTVDKAEKIDKVSLDLIDWLKNNDLINDQFDNISNFSFASCGNFDLNMLSSALSKHIFNNTSLYQGHELPIYFKEWVNVKKTFVNHKREWPKNLYNMMDILGEKPSGRLHSALSDCKNLAQVVNKLCLDGCKFYPNSKLKTT